ncbi:serine/threonine-protein phosphatase 4 regulatory subunit 4-like isoform X1 [Hylaeus anthracinus]|uniref:serine/threonine-protein phosphatase 4 regulatory subunit 4-like isoform X1 n=1 Tax=Hylaeus anthracinus TaxID=313031 RepID=UPI0023B8E810|nr:serine/threonine-protein phosphatase 4 regulatory subunit 4-like isoform X1 [Hylaeus anthracinus]
MLQEEDKAPYESVLDLKGDDFQKLSVIHNLPSLLATDTQSCMSRVVPKMQQSLPTASTEFHLAASSTFKTILEQKLVNHNVFSQTFLQSILNSLDSRDPVVCDAWLETLLDAIELLPVEVIRSQILPLTIIKGQLSQPIYSRVTCSRLLGKICTRFDSSMIQKEVLPTVHSLCQDVNSEVRASICLQLRFVAEGLGAESVKPALLPSLVELASDEESNVRCTSVQTIVYLLPHLQEDTIKTTIVPLVKKLCENAMKLDDNVICIIAQEFGKLVLGLEKCLIPTEKTWFLKYFQQLAQMGIVSMKKESKPHLLFITSNPAEDEKYMECRRCCAYNLPAMFLFVSNSADDTDALLITFNALAGDHYYMVRKTVAGGIHEVAKVLGPKNGRIKSDLIKLLKDDSEEVLQGLVPHIGLTLDCLAESQTIGVDRMDSTLTEIGRALLKCEAEISSTHNWRLTALMHSQLEIIAKYFPSDFIYSYFVPMAFFRILHARPIPVRLAAGTLYLFLLRYNMKAVQRIELRCKLYTELANSPDCYVRMMFVRMMVEAMDIFSSAYFKEHFFSVLLNLAEDPVANIRIKVVSLLPQLKSQLWMPTDKKLLTALETTIGHLMNSEKDRDVIAVLASVVRKLNEIKLKYDGQTPANKHTKQDIEDARKLEEEKRLSGLATGKSPPGGAGMKKGTWRRTSDNGGKTMPQTTPKEGSGSPRHSSEGSRARVQLTHPWERLGHTNTNASTAHANSDNGPCHDSDMMQAVQQNRSMPLIVWPDTYECNYEEENNIHSCRSDYTKSVFLAIRRENRRKSQQNFLLTRDYAREFSTNIASKDTANARTLSSAPNLAMLRALTKAAHYNSCWPCSSMPEIPVMLSDDEFLVDAGIRIPAQFSQSMSKIPHLQDSVFTKRRTLFNFERSRSVGMNFDKGKPKGNLSVEYEDCIKRRTNGVDQSNNGRTSMDCEDGLRMVKESLGKKVYYVGPLMRSRFGFGVNQERSMDEKMKRNSLILDKDKPKVLQTKCPLERTKRHSASFDKGKPKGKLSVEYENCIKRRTNGPNQSNNGRTSIDYEDGLRLGKEDQQQLDSKDTVYLGSMVRTRFGSINQERSIDEKMKRNSLVLDKDKPKLMHTKCTLDRTKRHSANFSLKPGDSKEMKPNMKCHSLEVVDYAPSERLGRALRRYSTLDVNHNQGLSKIPVRSFVPRSRTAPATRASSPVHIEKLCRMPFWES